MLADWAEESVVRDETAPTRAEESVPQYKVSLIKPSDPRVEVKVSGVTRTAFIDSGSHLSLVKRNIVANTPLINKVKDFQAVIKGVSGKTIPQLGALPLKLIVGKQCITGKFVMVAEDTAGFPGDLLIGMDFLKRHRAVCDFKQHELRLRGETVPIHYGNKETEEVLSVCTLNQMKIPPRHRVWMQLQVKGAEEGQRILLPKQEIKPNGASSGVLLPEALCTVHRGAVRVIAVNTDVMSVSLPDQKEILGAEKVNSERLVRHTVMKVDAQESNEEYLNDRRELEDNLAEVDYEEARNRLLDLLAKYRSVIALKGDSLGLCEVQEFEVKLEPGTRPIYIPPRRIPHSQRAVVDDLVKDMLDKEVIEPSNSPWSAPLVLVKKKSGELRPCVDYRKINACTVPDRFPLPLISDIIHSLGKAKVFSSLDLFSGYWQMPVEKSSRPMTAFTTQTGHYEFKKLPFGMRNGVASFSRMMGSVLTGLTGNEALVYLDDILIFTRSVEGHFRKLEDVLKRLSQHNLKVKLKKCSFLRKRLTYLGHLISERGMAPDPEKLSTLMQYPVPGDADQLRAFLGFVGYYRVFIPDFSSVASPLTQLFKKGVQWNWSTECQEAFEYLRKCLISRPILEYPDYDKKFLIATDASGYGMGAVLMQEHDGIEKPIAYASKLLTKAEKNYSVTEKEGLAVVWALKKFKTLIYGYPIEIFTDHQALVHLFRNKISEGRLGRWCLSVQDFNPSITYRPGKRNILPDCLSRLREETGTTSENDESEPSAVRLVRNPKSASYPKKIGVWNEDEIANAQRADEEVGRLIKDIEAGKSVGGEYYLCGQTLFIRTPIGYALVVPEPLVFNAIALCHDTSLSGHGGVERTLARVKERYHFKNMRELTEEYVKTCHSCAMHKPRTEGKVSLYKYPVPGKPFERVSMDIMGPFARTQRGYVYVLVFVDFLTRYVEIAPLRSRRAEEVAEAFRRKIIRNHGSPKVLISDNAAEFTSALFKELCKLLHVNKVEITAWTPIANGLCERSNSKVLCAIRHTLDSKQRKWDSCLPDVQVAINSSRNQSIGMTPYFALYHQDMRMPFDLLLKEDLEDQDWNIDEYIAETIERSNSIYRSMKFQLEKETEAYLGRHNQKVRSKKPLLVGSKCYIKNIPTPGLKPKLCAKFQGPYRIMSDLGKGRVRVENLSNGEEKTIHLTNVKIVPESTMERRNVQNPKGFGCSSKTNGNHREPVEEIDESYYWKYPNFNRSAEEQCNEGRGDLVTNVGQEDDNYESGEDTDPENMELPGDDMDSNLSEDDELTKMVKFTGNNKESTRYEGCKPRESFPLSPVQSESEEEFGSRTSGEEDAIIIPPHLEEKEVTTSASSSDLEGAVGGIIDLPMTPKRKYPSVKEFAGEMLSPEKQKSPYSPAVERLYKEMSAGRNTAEAVSRSKILPRRLDFGPGPAQDREPEPSPRRERKSKRKRIQYVPERTYDLRKKLRQLSPQKK